MGLIWKCLILSWILAVSCKVFFETLSEKRRWRHAWISYTMIPVWTIGFLVIAFTRIPAYILQPVRLIAVVSAGAGIYFPVKVVRNLVMSVLFSVFVWISSLIAAIGLAFFSFPSELTASLTEWLSAGLLLSVLLFLHRRYGDIWREDVYMQESADWKGLWFFPLISLISVVTFCAVSFDGRFLSKTGVYTACAGVLAVNMAGLYFMGNLLIQKAKIEKLRLMQERTQNQMLLYESVKKSSESQRRFMHDYKNQLACIQGLLADRKAEEAAAYIEKLGISFRKLSDCVNTNHAVVNVVLNQKYEYAREMGVTMVFQVNDLSHLVISEEDIVTILVNLIDNAVEACKKMETGRLIQLKMILENDQLVLSVKNPVREQIKIKNYRILSTKKDKNRHGIGLCNVRLAVERNGGTSALRCQDGWFYVSVAIPNRRAVV